MLPHVLLAPVLIGCWYWCFAIRWCGQSASSTGPLWVVAMGGCYGWLLWVVADWCFAIRWCDQFASSGLRVVHPHDDRLVWIVPPRRTTPRHTLLFKVYISDLGLIFIWPFPSHISALCRPTLYQCLVRPPREGQPCVTVDGILAPARKIGRGAYGMQRVAPPHTFRMPCRW